MTCSIFLTYLLDDRHSVADSKEENPLKMDNLRVFFALIKGYMAINILMTPKNFSKGGFLLSPILMIVGVLLESFGTIRLIKIAKDRGIYSFPNLMREAVGQKGLVFATIALAAAHFIFSIGIITFILTSL